MWHGAEPHEVGYLIVGGIAAALALGILALRAGDVWTLYRNGHNGERRSLAWERLLNCAGLVSFNVYMVIVAFRALSLPPRPWTSFYTVSVLFYYGTAVMMIVLTLFQWWIRYKGGGAERERS